MEAKIAQQSKIQSSIRQENHLLQASANTLKDQLADLSIALREMQTNEHQLKKAVVHSPDRIKADLKKAAGNLITINTRIGEIENERNAIGRNLENIANGEECIQAAMKVFEDFDEVIQEYEVVVKDAEDMRDKVVQLEKSLEKKRAVNEEKEAEIRALGACIWWLVEFPLVFDYYLSGLSSVTEMQALVSKTMATKRLEAINVELESVESTLRLVEKNRLDDIARIETFQKRIAELNASIEKDEKQTENEIQKMIASFREFERSFMVKHKALNQMINDQELERWRKSCMILWNYLVRVVFLSSLGNSYSTFFVGFAACW